MTVSDLEIPPTRVSEAAQHVIQRAVDIAQRREHSVLTNEHLFLAVAYAQWDVLNHAAGALGLNPRVVLAEIEHSLHDTPTGSPELHASPQVRLICKLALHHASRTGRQSIDAIDLLIALLVDAQGVAASIFRRHGVEPDAVIQLVESRRHELELRDEQLRKRFELPPALTQIATNLNMLARQDRLPPVFGRDAEIQQVLEILCHRERCNSVMLLGEPGVGKTAIVEGLARRLEFESDSVPVRLRDCHIVSLQMNALVAGTMLRGMFEDRLQNVIQEVKAQPNLILFVDEAHTMIGAGSTLGAPADAGNILKSALARGEIRVIGATTASEYKQHVQEDEALARRFRCVHVPEPSVAETRTILQKLRPRFERNYAVRIDDEAIETALDLSPRYMRHLHLPDKAVGWLDTAAVRAEMARSCNVTRDDVISVVAHAADIPRDMVARDVSARFVEFHTRLARRVVGQPDAIRAVTDRLILNKGPLKDGFDRPDGVLLFLGPTGVGKTELAKALAETLFGDERKMVRLDMSEYQDGAIAVDKLIGMPRGIVGSQRGGTFTNQLADTPYTVLLLDEIEKASPSVLNLFLQAFDEGWITDGRGRRVYLSDALVIMTSNVGSEHFRRMTSPLGFLSQESRIGQMQADVRREAERRFAPEFLNRIDQIVLFNPLTPDDVGRMASQYVESIRRTLEQERRTFEVSDGAIAALAREGYSPAFGARFLKRVIDERIKLPISRRWSHAMGFRVRLEDTGAVVVVPVERTPLSCVA